MSAGVFARAWGAGNAGVETANALQANSIALAIIPFERIARSLTRIDATPPIRISGTGSGVLDR
jgi:hypothetical protein